MLAPPSVRRAAPNNQGGSRGRSPREIFALTVCTNANVRSDFTQSPLTLALNMLSEWTIFTREVTIFSAASTTRWNCHPGTRRRSRRGADLCKFGLSCAKEARRALLAQTQAGTADVVQVAAAVRIRIVKVD